AEAGPGAHRAGVPALPRAARAHRGRAGPRPRLRGLDDQAAVVGDLSGPLGGVRRRARAGRVAGPARPGPRPVRDAPRGVLLPVGDDLGRLLAGATEHRRRAGARPAPLTGPRGAEVFFALTSDQQDFGAAVRTYLAERFDLDAVRAVVDDQSGYGHPAVLW